MIFLLLSLGFPSLDQYNVTWDEALGDLFFGERYLSVFTSFDPVFLDFQSNPYPGDRSPDLSGAPFRNDPYQFYPVANTLAAATSTVLSRWLGLLDPFDGFHALNLFLASLITWVFYRFLRPSLGAVAATAAMGFLFTSPRIVYDLMCNIKDFPLMVFYTLTVAGLFRALETGSGRWILACGVLWGLALGTKGNSMFLPGIPALLLLCGGVPSCWQGKEKRLFASLILAGLIGAAVMVAIWPYLWGDPIGRLLENFRHVASFTSGPTLHQIGAFQAILLTTPEPFLALLLIGLVPVYHRVVRRDRMALLLVIWIAVGLSRYLLPGMVNYDGVRHFLEVFPPMAAIAGLGAVWAAERIVRFGGRRIPSSYSIPVIVCLMMIPGALAVMKSHPFESAYWNRFAGGLPGARDRNLAQAGDYWGASYRVGLQWLNERAPRGSLVAVPVVEHAVRLVAPLRLRPDMRLLSLTKPYSPAIAPGAMSRLGALARQRPVFVMFIHRRDWMNELMQNCIQSLAPEAEWTLDGAPVLSIYRYQDSVAPSLSTRPVLGKSPCASA